MCSKQPTTTTLKTGDRTGTSDSATRVHKATANSCTITPTVTSVHRRFSQGSVQQLHALRQLLSILSLKASVVIVASDKVVAVSGVVCTPDRHEPPLCVSCINDEYVGVCIEIDEFLPIVVESFHFVPAVWPALVLVAV